MIGNFISKLFHKEKWPEGQDIRLILSAKGNKKDTVTYYSQEQFNIFITAINLGFQIINMPMIIGTMEPKNIQGFMN